MKPCRPQQWVRGVGTRGALTALRHARAFLPRAAQPTFPLGCARGCTAARRASRRRNLRPLSKRAEVPPPSSARSLRELRASCLPQIPCSASGLRAEWREAVARNEFYFVHKV